MRSRSNIDIDLNVTGHGLMKTVWENSERWGGERERERGRETITASVGMFRFY